jgi:hypothetical protein
VFWLIRRLFWFGTGASVGFGGAVWVHRRFRRAAARYAPQHVAAEVTTNLRQIRHDVREALSEGRSAMRSREAELRAELAPPDRRG